MTCASDDDDDDDDDGDDDDDNDDNDESHLALHNAAIVLKHACPRLQLCL